MIYKYCYECGTLLGEKISELDGTVPYCPKCGRTRHPHFNIAVSMIVVDKSTGKILLIRQYGKPGFILVAGYVNRGESAEATAARELKEETGLTAQEIKFNRTKFFEPSNTLMCNFTVFVADSLQLSPNFEIDSLEWFTPEEALENIRPNSLAKEFLAAYLSNLQE